MSGCRLLWINDTTNPPVAGGVAKQAYRRLGKWAFEKNSKWIDFIDAKPFERLEYLANALTGAFAGKQPTGADNISPRVLIRYSDNIPIGLSAADVTAYHRSHAVIFMQDGDDHAIITFRGDPKTIDFASYFGDYSAEETNNNIDMDRAQRMFGMGLMTRCR